MPQATVKIQPAPVPTRMPAAEVRRVPALVASTSASSEDADEAPVEDATMKLASAGVLVFAVATFGMQLWTFLTN